MKVVSYGRSARSFHIHAGSSASCFYIPDEKVVLFAEQNGTFGGTTYSFTDRKEMLEEAAKISEGNIPEPKGDYPAHYSNVTVFDYDTDKLKKLVEDARLGKTLEEAVTAGIKDLQSMTHEKAREISSIDPASLDDTTKAKLKGVMEEYVHDDNTKAQFYARLEPSKKKVMEKKSSETYLKNELLKLRQGDVTYGSDVLGHYMTRAVKEGLDDIAKGFAEAIYTYDGKRHGATHEERLQAAAILGKSEEEINKLKEENLLAKMSCGNYGLGNYEAFVRNIKKESEGIPPEKVKEIAAKVYASLTEKKGFLGTKIFVDKRKNIQYIETALLLARSCLGHEEVVQAGREVVEFYEQSQMYANAWETHGKTLASFELPDEIVRPHMLKIFEVSLGYQLKDAQEIFQRYKFKDEEIKNVVCKVHAEQTSQGNFSRVLQLRETYGHLIKDQQISTEDLHTLEGLMNFEPAEAIEDDKTGKEPEIVHVPYR